MGKRKYRKDLETISFIRLAILQRARMLRDLSESLVDDIALFANILVDTITHDGNVYIAGNGGSAGDAQHFAAELVGRFGKDRPGLPAIALTTDTSILTALANDYGYESVFSRQIQAIGRPGDLLIAMTTSGKSQNIIAAIREANAIGMGVVLMTNNKISASTVVTREGGAGNIIIKVPVPETGSDYVQEAHMAILHILCGLIDTAPIEITMDDT